MKVVPIRSARLWRAFFDLPREICMSMSASPPHRLFAPHRVFPIAARGPHMFLLAMEEGRPLARLFVGAARGAREGYFSLFDCYDAPDAVRALMAEGEAFLRSRGVRSMVGPVPPGPCDYGKGILIEGDADHAPLLEARNPPWYARHLEACGFDPVEAYLSYRVTLSPAVAGRYTALGDWAKRRFGLRVERGARPGVLARAFHSLEPDTSHAVRDASVAWRYLVRMNPGAVAFVARHGNEPAGYLIALNQGDRVRLATLYIAPEFRLRGVTAALLSALIAEFPQACEMEAGLIDRKNERSRALVERAGGEVTHSYRMYRRVCWY